MIFHNLKNIILYLNKMQTIKKISIILLLLILQQTILPAQSLNEKYWYYRHRLKYFTDIGEGSGKGVLFSSRHKYMKMHINNGTQENVPSTEIKIGDGGIDLGWYISMLALEADMLNSSPKNYTLTELYYAMKAYERWDLCEDQVPWEDPNGAELDGFFMRTDVSIYTGDFAPDFGSLNYDLTEDNGPGTVPPGSPMYVDHFKVWTGTDAEIEKELLKSTMSVDQAVFLIMGFALVNHHLGDNFLDFRNTVTGQNMSFNFGNTARNNILLISRYMANLNLEHGFSWELSNSPVYEFIDDILPINPYPEDQIPGIWTIFDPNGDTVGRGGHWPAPMSFGISEAVRESTGTMISPSFFTLAEFLWKNIPLHFHQFGDWDHPFPGKDYNKVFMAAVAAISGDSWDVYDPSGIFKIVNTKNYIDRFLQHDHDLLYMLLYTDLHNDNCDQFEGEDYESKMVSILNRAPICGPYNYSVGNNTPTQLVHFEFCDCSLDNRADGGWASSNFFRHTVNERSGRDNPDGNTGVYSGIDYLLFYNLYRNYMSWWYGGIPSYRNLNNRELDQDYPYEKGGLFYGTIENPANLRAFDTFEYNGKVSEENSNGIGGD